MVRRRLQTQNLSPGGKGREMFPGAIWMQESERPGAEQSDK